VSAGGADFDRSLAKHLADNIFKTDEVFTGLYGLCGCELLI
jgi:molecular chaperone DnaK (HSP70)